MSDFGRDLVESADEALAIAEGRATPARVIPVAEVDVAAIRQRLGLSQVRFAKRFGLVPATVRDWEQGRRRPDHTATALLRVIAYAPETVERALAAEKDARAPEG